MTIKESGGSLEAESSLYASPSPSIKFEASANLKADAGRNRDSTSSLSSSAVLTGLFPVNSFRDVQAWFRAKSLDEKFFPGNPVSEWSDQSLNNLTLKSSGIEDPTFGLDTENHTPYLSFSRDEESYMITDQELNWENGITVFLRFRSNKDGNENQRKIGSLLSGTKDPRKGSNLDNVPFNLRYVEEGNSNEILFKSFNDRAISYWRCDSNQKWTTFMVSISENWFSTCDQNLKRPSSILWKTDEENDLSIESPFKARLAVGFHERGRGRLNADINEIAVFDREFEEVEALRFGKFIDQGYMPQFQKIGRADLSTQGRIDRGGRGDLQSESEISSYQYVNISDIDTLETWNSAEDEVFYDGEEIITWDELSITELDTRATFQAEDDKGNPTFDIDYPYDRERWFSTHPEYHALEKTSFTIHLMGKVEDRSKFLSIIHGESEVFSLETVANEVDPDYDDLIVRFNTDFFASKFVRYNKLLENGSFFLLTLSVGAPYKIGRNNVTTYFQQNLNLEDSTIREVTRGLPTTTLGQTGRISRRGSYFLERTDSGQGYVPSAKPPYSLTVDEDKVEGLGDFLLEKDGFLRIDEGTFNEVILYRGADPKDRNFTWDWIYNHYDN